MNKNLLILLLFSFVVSSFGQTYNPLQVKYTEAWTDAEVNAMVAKIKVETLRTTKMDVLINETKLKPEGFNAAQTAKILTAFDFSRDKAEAIKTIDEKILGMTTKEVITVLNQAAFPSDKLAILQEMRFCITDDENKYDILNAIPAQKYKAEAKVILDQVRKPRSFIYGTVRSKEVIFVVDLSGSMEATFTANTGKSYSRLDFVKMELEKAIQSLEADSYFNIIFFESNIRIWKPAMQPATEANINSAVSFFSSYAPAGATNIYDALEAAYAYNRAKTIYFLTDGMPTAGKKTDVEMILKDVVRWNATRNIVIHTTAFLSGDYLGDNKPQSRDLMKRLAISTNGVYRSIE
ncbi:MAG TPA: hypothetical protein DCQ31_15440 [Bacteroidales bacterium]|nr:hypothetical protein [Bacteroidales bacterium]